MTGDATAEAAGGKRRQGGWMLQPTETKEGRWTQVVLASPHDGSIDGPWRFEYMSTRLPHLFRSTANMFARHCHRKVEKRGGGNIAKGIVFRSKEWQGYYVLF